MSQEQDDGWSSTVICTFTRKGGGDAMLVKERQTTASFLWTSRLFQGLKIWLQRVPQVSWWCRKGHSLPAVETVATEKGGHGGYVYCDHSGVPPANLDASVLANNCWPQGPDLTLQSPLAATRFFPVDTGSLGNIQNSYRSRPDWGLHLSGVSLTYTSISFATPRKGPARILGEKTLTHWG